MTAHLDTPLDTPSASGTTTPRLLENDTRHLGSPESTADSNLPVSKIAASQAENQKVLVQKMKNIDYDSDIDPDELLPVYLETKAKLFHLQPTASVTPNTRRTNAKSNGKTTPNGGKKSDDPEVAKLKRKLNRIENDILFDQYIADQKWAEQHIQLQKDAASARKNVSLKEEYAPETTSTTSDSDEDEVSRAAKAMGAALLEEANSDDDGALADLFESLPMTEVDPTTGKSNTVINNKDGTKVTIRDFGKWPGVSPRRVLEEACRAR